MIGLVLVSHSPKIAEGIADLIREMADCPLALAAGIDDPEHPIGTDAVKIMQAVEEVMSEDGVVILVDLGSAILSAQTALDLLEPEMAEKVSIAAAPLVEGALSAAIAASGGADKAAVLREAEKALAAKQAALGVAVAPNMASPLLNAETPVAEAAVSGDKAVGKQSVKVIVTPPHGLHARPAARLVAALRAFDAKLILEKDGRLADARSLNDITALQVRCGDEITLHAEGADAAAAVQSFTDLADNHFGDSVDVAPQAVAKSEVLTEVCGKIRRVEKIAVPEIPALTGQAAAAKLNQAAAQAKAILQAREQRAEKDLGVELADIFAAHALLLEDLIASAEDLLDEGKVLSAAWQESCAAAAADFQALDDPYLRARDADIIDIAVEMAFLLADAPRPAYSAVGAEAEIWLLEELLVSQVLDLPSHVVGVCVKNGNSNSHAALCCQGKNLPYVANWSEAMQELASGSEYCLKI